MIFRGTGSAASNATLIVSNSYKLLDVGTYFISELYHICLDKFN